jgi:hypothetical protein
MKISQQIKNRLLGTDTHRKQLQESIFTNARILDSRVQIHWCRHIQKLQDEYQQSRNNYGSLACCDFSRKKRILYRDILMVTKHNEHILITYKFIQ